MEPDAAKRQMIRDMRAASDSPAESAGGIGYRDFRMSMPVVPTSLAHVSGSPPLERELRVQAMDAAISLSWAMGIPDGNGTPAACRNDCIFVFVVSTGILSVPQRARNDWGTAIRRPSKFRQQVGTAAVSPTQRAVLIRGSRQASAKGGPLRQSTTLLKEAGVWKGSRQMRLKNEQINETREG